MTPKRIHAPGLILILIMAVGTDAAPIGATRYVSAAGSDSNDGRPAHPWRTIQHAAQSLRSGQTAIVMDGSYDERVSLTSSGAPGHPITLEERR